jgi:hypothetical protein
MKFNGRTNHWPVKKITVENFAELHGIVRRKKLNPCHRSPCQKPARIINQHLINFTRLYSGFQQFGNSCLEYVSITARKMIFKGFFLEVYKQRLIHGQHDLLDIPWLFFSAGGRYETLFLQKLANYPAPSCSRLPFIQIHTAYAVSHHMYSP